MKDMMNKCKCPECGYEADEMEFKDRPMKRSMNNDGGLSVYLIGEKEDDGGASEEEDA